MKQVARTGFTAANDATDLNQVGTVMEGDGGKLYRYVQVEDANLVANDVVEYSDATGNEVSKDVSGGAVVGRSFAGVAVNSVTDGNYGWVQLSGLATCKVAAGVAIAAGARVVTGSADGCITTATTANKHLAFGTALGADTATTSAAGTAPVMITWY